MTHEAKPVVGWDMVGQRTMPRALAYNREVIPSKSFIEYRGLKITYGQFGRAVCQIANGLRALGIRRGEHVMIYLPNCPEYLAAAFAIQRMGAVYVTCSTLAAEDEIRYQVSNGDVAAIIVARETEALVRAIAAEQASVRSIITVDCGAMDAGSATLNRMLVENSDRFDEP